MANRVTLFRTQFEEEGVTGDDRELRRVRDHGGTRVLTVFRSNDSNDLAQVRQAFVDETGALVDTRISRVNERDSALRLDISHAGGRTVGLSGTTTVLRGTDYSRSSLGRMGNAWIGLSPGTDGSGLTIDIDKGLAQAISGGTLVFEVDGSPPGAEQLAIVRDDPIVEWDFEVVASALEDEGVRLVGDEGVPARVLSNDDLLVLQFFDEAHRDAYSGFDGRAARKEFYRWLALELAGGALAHLSGQSWLVALAKAYSAYGVVEHADSAVDWVEGLAASSRVNVNKRGSQPDDRIQPGQEYGLDLFFDHTLTWERSDRLGQTDILACPAYTRGDVERARRDKSFRKRPAGATSDTPCQADITLKIQQWDTFSYRTQMTLAWPSVHSYWTACEEAGYDGYVPGPDPLDGRYYCTRQDAESSSKTLGTLEGLEHGFYWVIPRQAVRFGTRANLARPDEVVLAATMSLEVADDRGLYSRDLFYEVELRGRELHPDFYAASDGESVILDARASLVGPLVPADSVEFVWSYIEVDPGDTPRVRWRHTAPEPIFEVALADLGLAGDEGVQIQIRLEMKARGLRSESITKVVPIEAQAWNQTIFAVIQREAEEANRIDLKPEFRSRVGNLTLVVGNAMRTLELPEASGGDRPLQYSVATPLPPGLSFYSDSRQIRGTPTQEGRWDVRYRATDQDGDTAELRFTIRVTPKEDPDRRPVLPHIGDRTYDVGDRVSWQLPEASSGDGRKTYDLHGTLPPGLSFNRSDRRLSGTTTSAGRYPLRYEVRDEDGDRDSENFTIVVREDTDRPPPPSSGSFRDRLSSGGSGPVMVVIPAGSFRMGCLHDDCPSRELPVRTVSVPRFAVSKYEVTFDQWEACVSASGCNGHRPDDEGWGRGSRPVINVSWHDARSYTSWLSDQTGERYRLSSEAEWEYAARAGTTSRYHWGNDAGANLANCYDCGSRWDGGLGTAPTGQFPANRWGLHDVHGNVWEWTEDCWNPNFQGAPTDGSPWLTGDCSGRRVLRGGSWRDTTGSVGASIRVIGAPERRYEEIGFRVARPLTQ